MDDDFYIGWEEKAPASHGRATRRAVVALAALALIAALGLAAAQRLIGVAVFDWSNEQEFAGVLRAEPVPRLEVTHTNGTIGSQLLVAPWKFGFNPEVAREFDGQPVRLKGKRIHRDNRGMIEVTPGTVELTAGGQASPAPAANTSPGTRTLTGEIVDSKCWLGVMNPGRLTPHRACAVRCISGGIPPILLVQYDDGRKEHYLLVGTDGRALNREILDFVAEPVSIIGEVRRQGDLLVLRAEPEDIKRIESDKR